MWSRNLKWLPKNSKSKEKWAMWHKTEYESDLKQKIFNENFL